MPRRIDMTKRLKVQCNWTRFLALLICLITAPCFSDSRERPLQSRAIDGRLEFFYLYHEPEAAIDIIKQTAILGEFDYRFYFYEALFNKYPQEGLNWMKAAQIRIEAHPPLIYALWRAGLQEEALYQAQKAGWPIKKYLGLTNSPKTAFELPIDSEYLHCMCDYFFVTGDTIYIQKIIDVLGLIPDKASASLDLKELKEGAKYYLRLLMFHHDLAYQQCLKECQRLSGEARRLLEEAMEKHEDFVKRASFPIHNGMLNGDILITDSATFEEEWNALPVDSGPIGKAITTVTYPKDDKPIKIIPLFSGFALDSELNGYVTYDTDIYDPEGNRIYSSKDKLGLRRKIPSRFLVQAAADRKEITFEVIKSQAEMLKTSQDPQFATGVYEIQVTIKDHIGKKELKLSKQLDIKQAQK